jgi:serine phosphatase RsbU (regulator of sigma subunit)
VTNKLLFIFFLFSLVCYSQQPEGSPFIKNYLPSEYSAATDNWAVAQDERGIVYYGNASGVLEYDGLKWKQIPLSNFSIVRSISIADDGIVYVGGVGEFGYLTPDENGNLLYKSLVSKIPSDERDFADVWKTYATSEGVYFQTFDKLFRLSGDSIKIWKPEGSFHFSFYINNEFFINERGKGLKHVVNNEIVSLKNGEVFSNTRIYAMLPYSGNKILIATREKGLFLFDKSTNIFTSFPSELNDYLMKQQVYCGSLINDKAFAFGTLTNGVVIADDRGKILHIINKQTGLQDDIVNFIGVDYQKNLWIALGKGISYTEISSPLSFISDAQGVQGFTQNILKHSQKLYVATSSGVFVNEYNHFVPVKGIGSQTWSLLNFIYKKDTLLLAASEDGVYKIKGENGFSIIDYFGYVLYQSKINPQRVFIGMNDGLASFIYENGQWKDEDMLEGIKDEIRSIEEDNSGDLWLGTKINGLIKIHFTDKKSSDNLKTSWGSSYTIHTYNSSHGLPGIRDIIPAKLNDKIVFGTEKGIYEFDDKSSRFFLSPFLQKELLQNQVYRMAQKDSAIWLITISATSKETGVAYHQQNNSYNWYTKPFGKISEREIHAVYPDENYITWLGGPDGLLRYDARVKKDFSQPFYALVRRVTAGKDSVLFGGSFYTQKDSMRIPTLEQPDSLKRSISYSLNSIIFEYSATSYGDEQNNLYNVFLEGFDPDWSGWSLKSLKEYTNLKEGSYTFHVKAKNIYGTESIESIYTFSILPPWYRTIAAYAAYIVLFILFIYFVIQLSIRRLKRAKIQLEKTVKERTIEIVKQKEEIENQKLLVESKNKDITDSINYAQRIQRSLLASHKLLASYLKDYFIFFQPKDIVSGDFYWASKLADGKFAFVTADSTGHGVPGAIMSMLNISCLNEAVNGNKLTDPGEILNHTRKKIIDHLSNDGSTEGGKDGMDCSLVCFDFPKNMIHFSAANNPVWIVRNKQLIEFSPDKMPVGKHDNDQTPFRTQSFEVKENDVLYMLTDGMPDQFGGPKGKKFMYKQLKELLISISHLSMEEQHDALKTTLNSWKGELDQIDDVCVVGIKIQTS